METIGLIIAILALVVSVIGIWDVRRLGITEPDWDN
jgi:hypothetical protein